MRAGSIAREINRRARRAVGKRNAIRILDPDLVDLTCRQTADRDTALNRVKDAVTRLEAMRGAEADRVCRNVHYERILRIERRHQRQLVLARAGGRQIDRRTRNSGESQRVGINQLDDVRFAVGQSADRGGPGLCRVAHKIAVRKPVRADKVDLIGLHVNQSGVCRFEREHRRQ